MLGDLFFHFKKYADEISNYYNVDYVILEFDSNLSGNLVGRRDYNIFSFDSIKDAINIFSFDSIKDAMEKMHKEVVKMRDDGQIKTA